MTASSQPARTHGLARASARLRALRFGAGGAFGALLVATLVLFTVAFDAPHPLRVTFAVALLFWAPGHCVAVLATISDPLLFGVVTVASSISVFLVVSLTMFYLGASEGWTTLVIVACITVALAIGALLREGAL